jgi:plasmid maintenance system antidote protein VapI
MTGVNRKAIRPCYFGTSAQLWMNLQSKYDLAVAEDALRKQIEREVLSLSA